MLWISKDELIKINLIFIRHKFSSGISILIRHMGYNFTLSYGPFTRTHFHFGLNKNWNQNIPNDEYFKVEMMFRQKKEQHERKTIIQAIFLWEQDELASPNGRFCE